VPGIHRLDHVYHFFASYLTDYYPVRPHSETCPYELRHAYFAFAYRIGRPALHLHLVFYVTYNELCRVLNSYDPFRRAYINGFT
jgi:hypothetical protein